MTSTQLARLTKRAGTAALAAGLLSLAAGVGPPAPPTSVAEAAEAAHEAAVVIQLPGSFFEPAEITVPLGTTIKWVNVDSEDHDIVARDLSYESPLIKPGESWSFAYLSLGTFAYVCDLHAGMEGTVIVSDVAPSAPHNAFDVRVDAFGSGGLDVRVEGAGS